MAPQRPIRRQHRSEIVLFYKYFINGDTHKQYSLKAEDVEILQKHQQEVCNRLKLKGRILLSTEGINGTVSAIDSQTLETYLKEMENYSHSYCSDDDNHPTKVKLYENIDWKRSSTTSGTEPFPDLKISIVQEIVSTGGTVSAKDIPTHGGKHLSPSEFHNALDSADVVIDVRNTFEYDIGHFTDAINPEMVTFSSFVNFCDRNKHQWQNKQVLMYCTGGIRCEKASAMLKQRGVNNVSQLSGGIHRYLEEFGADGKFQGKNFVFDQRVAMIPKSSRSSSEEGGNNNNSNNIVGKCLECQQPYDELCGSRTCTVCRDLVLICPTCRIPLREYHCKKHQSWKDCYYSFLEIFTVEELRQQQIRLQHHRDGLLTATKQQTKRNRIRQKQKQKQKQEQKQKQKQKQQQQNSNSILQRGDGEPIETPTGETITSTGDFNNNNLQQPKPTTVSTPQSNPKNTRRTLWRQMEKIDRRIELLLSGQAIVEPNAPRRCRTCTEPLTICDGRCWGFWKTTTKKTKTTASSRDTEGGAAASANAETATLSITMNTSGGPLPIQVGDVVEPGEHWKESRLGDKMIMCKNNDVSRRRGTVVEVKTWAGAEPNDCVAVLWEDGQSRARNQSKSCGSKVQPQIYRWGVLAVDGKTRLYDVQRVTTA